MAVGVLGRTKQSGFATLLLLLYVVQSWIVHGGLGKGIGEADSLRTSIEVEPETFPNFTHSGYLTVDPDKKSKMFFLYYEAHKEDVTDDTPIIIWLQVRVTTPQCMAACVSCTPIFGLETHLLNHSACIFLPSIALLHSFETKIQCLA